MKKTSDIRPTMTDSQVLDFCKKGYVILPAVVPEEVNRRVIEYTNNIVQTRPELQAPRRSKEIEFHLPLLEEEWFVEHVLLNEWAGGAVRSLLGRDFTLPIIISDHRAETPVPRPGGWHRDGNYVHNKKLNYVEVFYHPEAVPMEKGPTEVLPGSHHLASAPVGHYGNLKGGLPFAPPAAPAGSILIMSYNLWHRRTRSHGRGPETPLSLQLLADDATGARLDRRAAFRLAQRKLRVLRSTHDKTANARLQRRGGDVLLVERNARPLRGDGRTVLAQPANRSGWRGAGLPGRYHR